MCPRHKSQHLLRSHDVATHYAMCFSYFMSLNPQNPEIGRKWKEGEGRKRERLMREREREGGGRVCVCVRGRSKEREGR